MFRLIAVLVTVALMGLLSLLVLRATSGRDCPEAGGTTTTLLPEDLQRQLDRVQNQPGVQPC